MNLDDGTDLTLSLVRDADGAYPLVYGTLVARDGTVRHLDRDAFTVEVTGHWTSPATGATYPAGWRVAIPGERLSIQLDPDGRRPGARHAGDDGGHLLGGVAGRPRGAGRDAARRRGLRGADGLRGNALSAVPPRERVVSVRGERPEVDRRQVHLDDRGQRA